MINYTYTSQYVNKDVLKKYIKYNLAANGYNRNNTVIRFYYEYGIMGFYIYYDDTYYKLELATLPSNCSTIYMMTLFDMDVPMHLLKSLFGTLKFTNILSKNKLNNYSIKIYDDLYITELSDSYGYTVKSFYKDTPAPLVKEISQNYFIEEHITYLNTSQDNGLANIIKYDRFPYHILYKIWNGKLARNKIEEIQKSVNNKILYIYYGDEHLFNNTKEETIYSFTSMRTHNYLDIRIIEEL